MLIIMTEDSAPNSKRKKYILFEFEALSTVNDYLCLPFKFGQQEI